MVSTRSIVLLLCGAALALPDCNRTAQRAPTKASVRAASSAVAATPPAQSGGVPSLASGAPSARVVADAPDAICERARTAQLPPTLSGAEVRSLGDCDAEVLYYGIGRPADFEQARKCALAQIVNKTAPIHGGEAILMMIYANGKGVPKNFDLATRYACEVGGAPAEIAGRLEHLAELRASDHPTSDFDLCDDITSGLMAGACAAHDDRIRALARTARTNEASAGLPEVELGAVDRTAKAFFDSREREEVDLTGTMRDVFMIEERAKLEDGLAATFRQLKDPAFAPPRSDANAAETELNAVYRSVLECRSRPEGNRPLGTFTAEGVRATERAWLGYRQALIALCTKARPDVPRDAWRAWITRERIGMLRALAEGC